MQVEPVPQPPPPPPPPPPADWWDTLVTSFTDIITLLIRGVLKFLGFLLIILIGWLISNWIGRLIAAVLRRVRFNEVADRTGLGKGIERMGVKSDASGLVGDVVKWIIRVVVLVIAFAALGLPGLTDALNRFILWLPNLVIAVAILFVAGLVASALADLVRGLTADAGFRNPNTLANITRIAVWAFAVVIAVNQVGIGAELVNTLLIAVVSAAGLALGLAFGLGGRDLAAQALDRWYRQAQGEKAARRTTGGA